MGAAADRGEVTLWLERWAHGDKDALDHLTPLVYEQLRKIGRGLLVKERAAHTLQATALVHETFRQLLGMKKVQMADRVHFYTFAAKLMRRILVDYARRWKAEKRGMQFDHLPLDAELAWVAAENEEALDLSTALEELESQDPAKARAIELHYFLGCTVGEVAEILGTSPSTIDRWLRFSLAWLHGRLHREGDV